MKPAKTIEPQAWMNAPETKAVMDALNDGQAVMALFVGGCVRNALLGMEVEDIDIATIHTPDKVLNILEQAGIKAIPTGIDHGTVTAVIEGKHFEITTLRKDVETDGRRAVVAFTDDWAEDAQRRDFTMNTLLADQDGNVFDPTGLGIDHLAQKRVIFVGDPAERIAEDALRILRFFRFHALYGEGAADENALAACNAAHKSVKTLSKERITQEFFKILSAEAPSEILNLMFEHSVLIQFKNAAYDSDILSHVCTFQNRYGLGFVASRLLVLAGWGLEHLKVLEEFLLIPKVFIKDMEAISKVLKLPDLSNEHDVRVAIYKYGRVASAQALMIELALDRVMNGYAPEALQVIQKWDVPNFPVSGEDLIAKGIKPGPDLGRKIEELESWWMAEGFKPSREECLAKL